MCTGQEEMCVANGIRKLLMSAALGAVMTTPVMAQGLAGAYLAARQAGFDGDYAAAAQYFTQALVRDPDNPQLLENAVLAQLSLGQIDRALPIAQKIEAQDLRSQVAQMVLMTAEAEAEDFAAVRARTEAGTGVGPLVDGLMKAWAALGEGRMSTALEEFDALADESGLRGFSMYHKALALASVGDFESAEEILGGPEAGAMQLTRRGAMARAEVLSQLERNAEAIELIDSSFGTDLDPGLRDMRAALDAGERLPFTHVRTARDGMAEVFYSVAGALRNEASTDYTLLYTRIAETLRPDHVDAILLSADLLDQMERYDLAVATYRKVPADHSAYHAAEMGRADALRKSGKPDAAIEVLQKLTETHGDLPIVHTTLGDTYRSQKDYASAAKAYDDAIALIDEADDSQWFVFYARGICHERLDQWDQAEADFRRALEIRPDQPQVLNYLGYSLVIKNMKLDEALDMIERAAAARPDSGYIIDSLGWVLFQLGRYDEAVEHMERAAELMPVDPVVNDHLGDVYWAVGRTLEAQFQWKRALSFVDPDDPDGEADPDRIRRKLEVGLDEVRAEEGAPPLRVANDDG